MSAKAFLKHRSRNNAYFDFWSIVHIVTGVLAAWIMDPLIALIILVLWEPLEVLVLSPIMAHYGIEFGHETMRNSLSDIVFDVAGVAIGVYILSPLVEPPFYLF